MRPRIEARLAASDVSFPQKPVRQERVSRSKTPVVEEVVFDGEHMLIVKDEVPRLYSFEIGKNHSVTMKEISS
ncbi:MAG: hypothetical protein KA035_04235 [Candidatus Levybacteria bacterium]|nr:hypothetical protein [Candidatus Levybacteria bacterium]